MVDEGAVLFLGDGADAGPRAAADVIVEASSCVLARDLPFAGQIGKQSAQHIQGLVDSPHSGEGAEVAGSVLLHAAGDDDAGIILLPGDLDVGVALVVLEANVVLGAVFLDEVTLQDKGLYLRVGDDEIEIGDVVHHAA